MLKNKKGLSAIVLTIIMIGLVLVAVGIVWTVVLNILEGQSESLEVSQKCIGIIIKPKTLSCNGTTCTVVLERGLGSTGDAVDGVGITLSNDVESLAEVIKSGNIAATGTISITTGADYTNADVRVYFDVDGEENFCSQVSSLQ